MSENENATNDGANALLRSMASPIILQSDNYKRDYAYISVCLQIDQIYVNFWRWKMLRETMN